MLSAAALAGLGKRSGGSPRDEDEVDFPEANTPDVGSDCHGNGSSQAAFSRNVSKQAPPSVDSGPPPGLLSLAKFGPETTLLPASQGPEPGGLCGRCAACGVSMAGGWSPPRAAELPASPGGPHAAVLLEDKRMLGELSESMMGKLNNVFVFLQQTLSRERGKHSSDISMMMRKVDKDLKDTFLNVRETFAGLTDQLTQLVKEVENGRKQVKSIQAKYAAAKEAAEAQAQYVIELEAVLDSQGSGLSDILKQLSEKYSNTQQSLAKLTEEGKQKVQALQKDNKDLKLKLRRFEDEEREIKAGKEPPALPEMTASWTRHMTPSTRAPSPSSTPRAPLSSRRGSSFGGSRPGSRQWRGASEAYQSTVVASMMAHCDAKRAAPRTKAVQLQEPRACSPQTPTFRGRDDEQLLQFRRRAEVAEGRCKKQHRLLTFASGALLLLKDVFLELRSSRCLTALDEPKGFRAPPLADTSGTVERIAQLFHGAVPRLGNLSEVITALSDEIAKPPLEGAGVAEWSGKERTPRSESKVAAQLH